MTGEGMLWALFAFAWGSLPFSVWVGRLALRKDIRTYGDGNPGATNVFRAGGKMAGVVAALLDMFKGLLPVALAFYGAQLRGWDLVAVALAPSLGHAFSPFLGFRGGKAVGVTFGVWVALTIWEVPTVYGLMLFYWFRNIAVPGWSVIFAGLSALLYLRLAHPDPTLMAILVGNLIIFAAKHRADLAQAPRLRGGIPERRWLPRL